MCTIFDIFLDYYVCVLLHICAWLVYIFLVALHYIRYFFLSTTCFVFFGTLGSRYPLPTVCCHVHADTALHKNKAFLALALLSLSWEGFESLREALAA